MRIIGSCKTGMDVKGALDKVEEELNTELQGVPGKIVDMRANVEAGLGGAVVEIMILIDGADPANKFILGVNEKGISEEHALKRARDEMNKRLGSIDGGVLAGFYVKTLTTPVPGRVFSTILAAINEEGGRDLGTLSSEERRTRLQYILSLLGNDPKALNISRVAELFGTTRNVIYSDLERIGHR